MAVKTQLPSKLAKNLRDVGESLREFVTDQRSAFDEMSERWLEGDKASSVEAWLEELEDFLLTLENVQFSSET
jgi:hypothetical protein